MAKGKKSIFFCQNCGHEEAKWLGQCPACKEWNTFVEERIDSGITKGTTVAARAVHEAKVVPLTEVTADDDTRSETGIKELDRVLGGGIVPGSLVLVGGDPGIGKSTLLLQVCRNLAESKNVLYISGEESLRQIKLRADRIGEFSDKLSLLCETNLDVIDDVIRKTMPDVVIIDSIQTMFCENTASAPGSVSQVRESTSVLMQLAKGLGIEEPVNSPTFTIVQVYEGGRLPFYHFDVYRIGDVEEMDEVGFDEYVSGEGVSLIEWANLIEEILPENRVNITIEKDLEQGFDFRRITIEERGKSNV